MSSYVGGTKVKVEKWSCCCQSSIYAVSYADVMLIKCKLESLMLNMRKETVAIEPTEERNDAILQSGFCLFAPLDKIRGTLRKGCWSVE